MNVSMQQKTGWNR